MPIGVITPEQRKALDAMDREIAAVLSLARAEGIRLPDGERESWIKRGVKGG